MYQLSGPRKTYTNISSNNVYPIIRWGSEAYKFKDIEWEVQLRTLTPLVVVYVQHSASSREFITMLITLYGKWRTLNVNCKSQILK